MRSELVEVQLRSELRRFKCSGYQEGGPINPGSAADSKDEIRGHNTAYRSGSAVDSKDEIRAPNGACPSGICT